MVLGATLKVRSVRHPDGVFLKRDASPKSSEHGEHVDTLGVTNGDE